MKARFIFLFVILAALSCCARPPRQVERGGPPTMAPHHPYCAGLDDRRRTWHVIGLVAAALGVGSQVWAVAEPERRRLQIGLAVSGTVLDLFAGAASWNSRDYGDTYATYCGPQPAAATTDLMRNLVPLTGTTRDIAPSARGSTP